MLTRRASNTAGGNRCKEVKARGETVSMTDTMNAMVVHWLMVQTLTDAPNTRVTPAEKTKGTNGQMQGIDLPEDN